MMTSYKKYIPLASVFAVVIAATLILNYVIFDPSAMQGMQFFMGSFFVVFGLFKVAKLKDFAVAYREYDLLAMGNKGYAYLYPFIELALGVAYFASFELVVINWITLVLMAIGAIGVLRKLLKGETIMCACLGTVFKVPMTWVTLIEDLAMAVMAGVMLVLM